MVTEKIWGAKMNARGENDNLGMDKVQVQV